MGIIKNGITGAFSGKVGPIVGYINNGQGVIRAKGKRKKRATPAELLNRKKFALSQKWLKPLLAVLRIGSKDYQPTYQGFVAAKSYAHKHALKCDDNNEFYIDPALVLLSFGNQPLPLSESVTHTEGKEIVFTWSNEGRFQYNDQAMGIVYDAGMARRNNGTATLELPYNTTGTTFHIYLAFIADDRSSKSNSRYLGSFQI